MEWVTQLSSESRFIPLPGLIDRCGDESFLPHPMGGHPSTSSIEAANYQLCKDHRRTGDTSPLISRRTNRRRLVILTQFTTAYLNRININLTQNTGQAREGLTDYLVDIISNLETVDWEIPDSLPNVCMRSPDLTGGNPSIQAWQIMAVVPASLRSCRPT